jgi:hypothetical protein
VNGAFTDGEWQSEVSHQQWSISLTVTFLEIVYSRSDFFKLYYLKIASVPVFKTRIVSQTGLKSVLCCL